MSPKTGTCRPLYNVYDVNLNSPVVHLRGILKLAATKSTIYRNGSMAQWFYDCSKAADVGLTGAFYRYRD